MDVVDQCQHRHVLVIHGRHLRQQRAGDQCEQYAVDDAADHSPAPGNLQIRDVTAHDDRHRHNGGQTHAHVVQGRNMPRRKGRVHQLRRLVDILPRRINVRE